MVFRRLILPFLIAILLLYDEVESKRGGSSGRSSSSRGSSGSRSSSRSSSSSSSGSKSSWFGSGSSSRSSSSSSSSSWGSGSSSSRSHSGGGYGGSSRPSHYYGSAGRGWRNRYYGNNIVVMRTHTYYRGGGYGNVYSSSGGSASQISSAATKQPVETPTVTTEMIKDVLFPGDPRKPSKEIFDYDESAFRMKFTKSGHAENMLELLQDSIKDMKSLDLNDRDSLTRYQKMGAALSYSRDQDDEHVIIKNDELPVIIGSIPYFWGDKNLPQGDNETDCADFSAINDVSNFTICNVTAMIRCHKSLSDVIVVGHGRQYSYSKKENAKLILKTANGSLAEEFAWFCPPTDKCCEWECCSTEEKEHTEFDPPDNDFVGTLHTIVVLSVMGLLMALCCGCCYFMNQEDAKAGQSGSRTQQQRQQQSVEMEPLTAPYPSYPRQPPIQTQQGANYGWSVKPSAPPSYD